MPTTFDLTDFIKWLKDNEGRIVGRGTGSWELPICYWLAQEYNQIGQIEIDTVSNITNLKTNETIPEQGWMSPFIYILGIKYPRKYVNSKQCLDILYFLFPEIINE